MVGVVQLANTSDCGSEDRGFEPRLSPHIFPKGAIQNGLIAE